MPASDSWICGFSHSFITFSLPVADQVRKFGSAFLLLGSLVRGTVLHDLAGRAISDTSFFEKGVALLVGAIALT